MAVAAEVLFGGELLVEAGGLKDGADLATKGVAMAVYVLAQHLNGVGGRGDEGAEYAEESGFAAAVGAEEAEDFGGVDGESEVVECDASAIPVGEGGDLDDGGVEGFGAHVGAL